MLPPYSVRAQIRTLLEEYNSLGSFYRKNKEAFNKNYFLFKVVYDLIGPARWESGEWKNDPAFARVLAEVTRIGKQDAYLKEELESIELDAYNCYCSISKLIRELGERCEGSGRDLLRGNAQGFNFEG